uniref:DNA replication ATP-dependent helicase/nuclease n=1 Tax=Ciona savignyi TaxID=51511 RepID=H2ZHQ5_CIOSA
GDIVNLVPENTGAVKGNCTVVDDKNNILVLHPDALISGTTVSNGLGCLRRAILNERFKIPTNADNISPVMLVGTIVHSVFQSAVKLTSTVTRDSLLKLAKDAVSSRRYFSDMYVGLTMNTDSKTVLAQVESYIPQIESWIKEYKRDRPTTGVGSIDFQLPITAVPDHLKPARGSTVRYNASTLNENVWPRFGLKGKIDLTGKFRIKNNKTQAIEHSILPLELKTGKDSHSMEHHVQVVAIYTMFCNERRNKDGRPPDSLPAGLLLYLKNVKSSCVPLKRADQTGVLLLRNKIADYLAKTTIKKSTTSDSTFIPSNFPPTIDNTRSCQRCSQLRNCALMSLKAAIDQTSELMVLLSQIFEHLTDTDLAYFKHWATCTFLEEQETNKKEKQKRFWLKTANERMSEGKCITNLEIAGSSQPHSDLPDSMVQTFKRYVSDCGMGNTFQIGEMVLISGTEPNHIAMATGVVHAINQSFISITTDRCVPTFWLYFFIDRHVWLGGISVQSALSNLSILMSDNPQCNMATCPQSSLILCFKIVKIMTNFFLLFIFPPREPSFVKNLDFVPRSAKDEVGRMLRGLNRTQRQAIKRVLLSKDYTLVVGMPGSGKTTTIVAMIRILLLCGLRVLVTSYTHSAVDNLLIKLIKYKTKFLRLGRSGQVHPSVHPYTEEGLSLNMKTPRELLKLYDESRVVACTCLAVTSHAFFAIPSQNRPIFDVCIVDEASQIAQPACLAPLLHSRRFVLVGDHLQLPPLVVSQEARKMGADESLFRRLTSHKPALCELTLQYRMNKDIMELSNHVTYEGRLECAHPSVADSTVKLDNYESMKTLMTDDTKWLNRAIDPKISVLFLDTSQVSFVEKFNQGIHNTGEAKIISALTKWLIKAGCNASRIGIIAPFRKQLKAIEEKLNQIEGWCFIKEMFRIINTVDKYQGRDKSVILVSFVRSKEEALGEKLLNDWRRLNVAITRAKHKLVMVGCTRSLMEYDPCKKIIEYVRSKDLVHF